MKQSHGFHHVQLHVQVTNRFKDKFNYYVTQNILDPTYKLTYNHNQSLSVMIYILDYSVWNGLTRHHGESFFELNSFVNEEIDRRRESD